MRRIFLLALFLLVADTVWSQTLCTENRCVKLQDELGFYVDTGNPLPTVQTTPGVAALTPCTENRCVKLADKNGNYIDSNNPLPTTGGGGGGGGTVTSFSAGNLSPLFTTSVATATTTPALTFALSNAAAHTYFGNNTGSSGAPSYVAFGTGVDTALGVAIGSAGAPVLFNGAGGTPSSLTLTNATGLPPAGVTGTAAILGANVFTATQNIAAGGLLGVGTSSTPVTDLYVATTSTSDPRGIMSAQYTTDAIGARLHLRKARGTEASPTTIVTGDVLGRVRFSGYDGSNYLQMGSIDVTSTGTIAATRVPTTMTFSTATDAAPSVLTTAMTIGKDQSVTLAKGLGVGATAPTAGILVQADDGLVIFNTTNASNPRTLFGIERNGVGKWDVNLGTPANLSDLSFYDYGNANYNFTWGTGTRGLRLAAALPISFSATADSGATVDLSLFRDAANIAAWRNSTNPQNERWYNTYTDASNNEYLQLGFTSNVATLSTVANGTGTLRNLTISANSVAIDNASNTLVLSHTGQGYFGTSQNVSLALYVNNGFGGFALDTSNNTRIRSGSIYGWSSSATVPESNALDTGLARNAAGVVEANNGSPCSTASNCRDIKWRHSISGGTAPTVANTTSNSCGTTAATIAGGDMAGKVTVGATSGTSCTVTFGTAWGNAPACAVNNETTSNLVRATSTTTTVILAGTFVGGDVLSYTCQGY